MFPAFRGSLSAESSKAESSKRRRATTPVPESEQQMVVRPKKKPSLDANGHAGGLRDAHLSAHLLHLSKDTLEIPSVIQISPMERLRQILQHAFSQTTYGKDLDELLSPEKGFYAMSKADGDLELNNYEEIPREKPPYKGVCNNLAYAFGQLLQKFFNGNAEVRVGEGPVKDYFANGTHYFLLAWPKARHDEVMRDLENQQFSELAMMVDPSFKKMLSGKDRERLADYTLLKVMKLDELHPDRMNRSIQADGWQMPIGFIRDLAPESVAEYGAKALLFLQFNPPVEPGGMACLKPVIQRQPRVAEYDDASGWLEKLPENNRFKRFYHKVISDLCISHMAHSNQDLLPDVPSLVHSMDDYKATGRAEPSASISELPDLLDNLGVDWLPDVSQPFLGQNQVHYMNPFRGDQGIDPKLIHQPFSHHQAHSVLVVPDEASPPADRWLHDAPLMQEPLLSNEEISRLGEGERNRYFERNPLAEVSYVFWTYDKDK